MRLENTERQMIVEHAEFLKVDPAFIAAVIEKESAGKFLWNVNGTHLPAIRIEGHYFHRLLKNRPEKLAAAVAQGLAHPKAGAVKNPTTMTARYDMLDRMSRIDEEAAYRSISIGAGQIMGDHFRLLKYSSPVNMWRDARVPVNQMRQIIRFIEENPRILAAVRAADFKTFAKYYNGPQYRKNKYDTLLQSHYYKWRSVFRGTPPVMTIDERSERVVWEDRVFALGFKTIFDFQTHYGLKPDGIIGVITKEAIVEAEKAKAKPVKDAAVVASGATTVAVGAVTVDQIVKHVEAVKPVIETLAGMNVNTILAVAAAVAAGAVAYGVYKWWRS